MFLDARTFSVGTVVKTDIAIIGAGAAGISIALDLAPLGARVCLIESGGLEPDDETQALYAGESVGMDYFPLETSRLRFFGGTTGHWGGWCRPLDPIDFESRAWIPNSGWPINRRTLEPYYARGRKLCELGPVTNGRFDHWARATGSAPLRLAGDRFRTNVIEFSPPTRFGTKYRSAIARARNILTLLYANVTEIVLAEDSRSVVRLEVASLDGTRFGVTARLYVLATGGIENARNLLLSAQSRPTALGNRYGLVGRFFMEHLHPNSVGYVLLADPSRLPQIYYRRVTTNGKSAMANLMPTEEFLRKEGLLNASITIGTPIPAGDVDETLMKGVSSLWRALDPNAIRMTTPVISWIGCSFECAPNPESRISLSSERDALGLAKARLDWRMVPADTRSARRILLTLSASLAASRIGRCRIFLREEDFGGGNHHMGTTRMSKDPRSGVVDADCRVHGMTNLFVAGSSVFPTGGAVNPTLTIVALALRLADHLKGRLAYG